MNLAAAHASSPVCETFSSRSKVKINGTGSKSSKSVKRKTWRSRRISRILGRDTSRCQSHPSCNACIRCLPHRRRKVRSLDLNLAINSLSDSQATLVGDASPQKNLSCDFSIDLHHLIKRKHTDITAANDGHAKSSPMKRAKRSAKIDSASSSVSTLVPSVLDQKSTTLTPTLTTALTTIEKEKQRQKEKKKRQRATKQRKAKEQRDKLELQAKQAEDASIESRRFLVRFPLERVGDLSGRSVSRNFRKADLDLNEIVAVSLDVVLGSSDARSVYECLQRPLYFDASCTQKVEALKRDLAGVAASKLITMDASRSIVKPEPDREPSSQQLILNSVVLDAIEHVLKDTKEPQYMESSQNSEEKIKSLFKPVLGSLGMDDILVTNGFVWREKIALRSTVDLGIHNYAPKSDVAIVQVHDDEHAQILVVFEAYSKAGQSNTTPDMNRADRVRLLIQGSYISRKESKPSVVFYLTRDKHMETILVFSPNGQLDEEKARFCYYAEKCPFYSQASWISLLCQTIPHHCFASIYFATT
ncbi:hypothetical protein BDY19DRAFT_912269 [Irpex rosettiformis]|uniref:Uncharacterized protein n=1 Tax=Irpex rosettiformis TaxID=378272 RepID=A0ACB8UJI1_9APHY|nr:hypothetical protein BDY19DRAFT_912269 [Irpex rosettiformis]